MTLYYSGINKSRAYGIFYATLLKIPQTHFDMTAILSKYDLLKYWY